MTTVRPVMSWNRPCRGLKILGLCAVNAESLDAINPCFDFFDESRSFAPSAPNPVVEGVVSRRPSSCFPCALPLRCLHQCGNHRTAFGHSDWCFGTGGWACPSRASRGQTSPPPRPWRAPTSHAAARAGAWPSRRPRGSFSTKPALGEGCCTPPFRTLWSSRTTPPARASSLPSACGSPRPRTSLRGIGAARR